MSINPVIYIRSYMALHFEFPMELYSGLRTLIAQLLKLINHLDQCPRSLPFLHNIKCT